MIRPSPLAAGDSETLVLAEFDRRLDQARSVLSGYAQWRAVRQLERGRDYLSGSRASLLKDALLTTLVYVAGLVALGLLWRDAPASTSLRAWPGRINLLLSGTLVGVVMALASRKAGFRSAKMVASELRSSRG